MRGHAAGLLDGAHDGGILQIPPLQTCAYMSPKETCGEPIAGDGMDAAVKGLALAALAEALDTCQQSLGQFGCLVVVTTGLFFAWGPAARFGGGEGRGQGQMENTEAMTGPGQGAGCEGVVPGASSSPALTLFGMLSSHSSWCTPRQIQMSLVSTS